MSSREVGPLSGKKILITGATGQVAGPVVESLAEDNEVWCLGRFTRPGTKEQLIARGIRTWQWDMGRDSLSGLPDDFTHVLHSAVDRGNGSDFNGAIEINSVGAARLMSHCRHAEAFLYVSTGAVYVGRVGRHLHRETDPVGGVWERLPTYPMAKLAAEGVVRALAVTMNIPAIIARLDVAYGPYGHGGMPILRARRMLAGEPQELPNEGQAWCMPIHTDDVLRQVPLLWREAAVPAQVVNWGGDDLTTVQDILTYMSEVLGVRARFVKGKNPPDTRALDHTNRKALIGDCKVNWQDGLRKTLEVHFPESFGSSAPATTDRQTASQ